MIAGLGLKAHREKLISIKVRYRGDLNPEWVLELTLIRREMGREILHGYSLKLGYSPFISVTYVSVIKLCMSELV